MKNTENLSKSGKCTKGKRYDKRAHQKDGKTLTAIKPEVETSFTSKDNPPELYTHENQLSKDVGTVSFFQSLGTPVAVTEAVNEVKNSVTTNQVIPGIMRFCWFPVLGRVDYKANDDITTLGGSYMQQLAWKLFTVITAGNSRSPAYDPADLLIYLMQLDSLHTVLYELQAVYGIARTFSTANRYLPQALIEAKGYRYESIVNNLVNFRTRLNYLANRISSMVLPANVPMFIRHKLLAMAVISESSHPKAQLYVPCVTRMYTFTTLLNKGTKGAGALQLTSLKGYGQVEWTSVMDTVEHIIDTIVYRQDFAIMSSDILKALGQSAIIGVPEIEADFKLTPAEAPGFLEQFKNATPINDVVNIDNLAENAVDFDIYQDDGIVSPQHIYLKCDASTGAINDPEASPTAIAALTRSIVLFANKEDVSVGETLELSRLKLGYAFNHTSPEILKVAVLSGTEIFEKLDLCTLTPSTGDSSWLEYSTIIPVTGRDISMTQFQYHPMCIMLNSSGKHNYVGDVDHYAVVNTRWLNNVHVVSIMSEFDFQLKY